MIIKSDRGCLAIFYFAKQMAPPLPRDSQLLCGILFFVGFNESTEMKIVSSDRSSYSEAVLVYIQAPTF